MQLPHENEVNSALLFVKKSKATESKAYSEQIESTWGSPLKNSPALRNDKARKPHQHS